MKTINDELRDIQNKCSDVFYAVTRLSDVFSNNFAKFGSTDDLYSLEYCSNICAKLLMIQEYVTKISKLNN